MDTIEIVRVKFRWPGKIVEFQNPNRLVLKRDEPVVCETLKGGTMIGKVSIPPRIRIKQEGDDKLKNILKVASDSEMKLEAPSDIYKKELKSFFETRVRGREIRGVKFIDCELTNSGKNLIVYYRSENKKFDYRGMAKEMAGNFGHTTEMRLVGIRDAAKVAGGIGKCGLSLCCSTWLPDFEPVTIRMAKDQGVSLEPESINGQCGRLLCCLGYEHQNYADLVKGLPKVGKIVITPQGEGRVTKVDIIRGIISVRSDKGQVENFDKMEVKRKFGPGNQPSAEDQKKQSEKKAEKPPRKSFNRNQKKPENKKGS